MRPEVNAALAKAREAAKNAGREIGRLKDSGGAAILVRAVMINAFVMAYCETRFGREQVCDCREAGGVACAGCEDRTLGPRRCLDEVAASTSTEGDC